jgi:hypothetical protein
MYHLCDNMAAGGADGGSGAGVCARGLHAQVGTLICARGLYAQVGTLIWTICAGGHIDLDYMRRWAP